MIRQWWRRRLSELRYEVEQKMVWYVLRRHPERCFVRILFETTNGARPVLAPCGPADAGEQITAALIHTLKVGGGHFHDTTDLIPLERRLDALYTVTNFVDMRVQYQYGALGVRIMARPRIDLAKKTLPLLPDWNDPNWHEWDLT